jgi:hypothetical protein
MDPARPTMLSSSEGDPTMKRLVTLLSAALLVVGVTAALAHDHDSMSGKSAAAVKKTITGEVVDTGCYLSHEARGEKHISCATKCIGNGMPMGLLTDNGTLYLITLNHDNADPYNALKAQAGKKVSVTGTVMARNGMKAIDVEKFEPMAANTK